MSVEADGGAVRTRRWALGVVVGAAMAAVPGAAFAGPVVNSQSTDVTLRPTDSGHAIVMRDVAPPRGARTPTSTAGGHAADVNSVGEISGALRSNGSTVPLTIARVRMAGDGGAMILNVARLSGSQVARLTSSPRAAASSTTSGSLQGRDGPTAKVVGTASLRIDGDDLTTGDGPPAIAATFHGGSGKGAQNNVWTFDADGDVLTDALLNESSLVTLDELRGLVFAADGSLFVANSNKDENQILRYGSLPDVTPWGPIGEPPYSQGKTIANPGLVHPYGLALSPDQTVLYASSQNTSVVTQLGGPVAASEFQGAPGAVGSYLSRQGNFLPGTVAPGAITPSVKLPVDDPSTVAHSQGGLKEPRGIALSPDGTTLYAADDSGGGGVVPYDAATGLPHWYAIDPQLANRPVGVAVDSGGIVWVTSKGSDAVLAYTPATQNSATVVSKAQLAAAGVRFDDPAGIAPSEGASDQDQNLVIANRRAQQIVCVNPNQQKALVLADDLPDEPEQVALLPDERVSCTARTG